MKIVIRAIHKVLLPVTKLIDSAELSEMMGKLIHFGYDIEHEEMLGKLELRILGQT